MYHLIYRSITQKIIFNYFTFVHLILYLENFKDLNSTPMYDHAPPIADTEWTNSVSLELINVWWPYCLETSTCFWSLLKVHTLLSSLGSILWRLAKNPKTSLYIICVWLNGPKTILYSFSNRVKLLKQFLSTPYFPRHMLIFVCVNMYSTTQRLIWVRLQITSGSLPESIFQVSWFQC